MTTHGDDRGPDDFSRPPSTDGDDSLFDTPLSNARITQAQLADLLGVSRQAVNKQVRRGAVRVDADRMMPARRGLADWKANVDPARTRARFSGKRSAAAREDAELRERLAKLQAENVALRQAIASPATDEGGEGGGAGFAELRAQQKRLEIERLQLVIERERGQWLDRAEVVDAFDRATVLFVCALEELPARVVEHLDVTDEQKRILIEQLTDGVNAIRGNLVRDFERGKEAGAGGGA
jgi:transcriptional regulator with XRE-family HTH domain